MKSWLLVLMMLLSGAIQAEEKVLPLTKVGVSAMLDEMTSAVKRHDANALMAHFASDARITIMAPAQLGGTQQLSVAQYRQMLMQGWAQGGSTYAISDVAIRIAEDGRSAMVEDTVRETINLYGQSISSTSRERMTVVLQGGKQRIAFLHATLSVTGL